MIEGWKVYLVVFMTALMMIGCGGGGGSSGTDTVITDPGDEDTVKPVITVSGGTTSMTVGGTYTAPTVTAVDNIDGDISALIIEGGDVVDPDTVGTYTVTYNVSDSSGNTAIEKTHTVVVNSLTNTAPSTPTGLTAQVISSTQIDVSWNASTDDVSVVGYYVWRNGSLTIVNGTSHSATGLLPQTQYCFKVAAYDQEGAFSAVSDELCADTNDGSTPWITLKSGTHNELSNIVWTGDRFWVVEENFGTPTYVYSSFDNGESWNKETTSGFSFDGADEVVYGNAEYIAVERRTIFRSVDGVNWPGVFYADSSLLTVAWSPSLNRYVAGGEEGYIVYSDNGSDWNVSTISPTPNDIKEIVWLNDRFFALDSNSSGEIFTSTDGENWTRANTPSLSLSLNSIAWNGKSGAEAVYLAGGWNTVLRSFDGINWSVINTERLGYNDKIIWAGGSINLFVIAGYENHIYTSADGEIWEARLMPQESTLNQLDFKDIAWDGTALVVVGENGTISRSIDGIEWHIVVSGSNLNTVMHDGSQFIVGGHNGRMLTSTDADTWSYHYMGDDNYYVYGIASNGTEYVAAGQTYGLYSSDLFTWDAYWEGATSVDTAIVFDGVKYIRTGEYGILTWDGVSTYTNLPDPRWEWSLSTNTYMSDLDWDGTRFVAVGYSGVIYTSADATNGSWSEQNSTVTQNLYAVTKNDTRYVAVGAAGTIITSDDNGTTWVARTSNVTVTLNDAAWTGNEFIVVGNSGHILTSDDGAAWIDITHTYVDLNGVTAYNSDIVIVGDKGTVIRNNQ